jgi:hypothetical protein
MNLVARHRERYFEVNNFNSARFAMTEFKHRLQRRDADHRRPGCQTDEWIITTLNEGAISGALSICSCHR